MKLSQKTALITGASGGIGAVIALCFAEAGAKVLLGYGQNQQGAIDVKAKIEAGGGQAELAGFDVTDEAPVEAAFAKFATQNQTPGILINNAGVFSIQPLMDMRAKDWDEAMRLNLRGTFLCSREAVASGTCRAIVNIASIAANLSHEHLNHYCAAKAGVVSLTRNMAREFGPAGVRVNAVSPGLVWRETLDDEWPQGVEKWNNTAPLGRVVQPKEVAKACLFLASDDAAAITGIDLTIDAGISVVLPF